MTTSITFNKALARFLAIGSAALFLPALVVNTKTELLGIALLLLSMQFFLRLPDRPLPHRVALSIEGLGALLLLLLAPQAWQPALIFLTIASAMAIFLLPHWTACRPLILALRRLSWWHLFGLALVRPMLFGTLMIQQDIPGSSIAHFLAKLCGIPAALVGNELWLQAGDHLMPFIMTAEWTGLFFKLLAFLVLALPMLFHKKSIVRLALFIPIALLLHGLSILIQCELMIGVNFYEWPYEAWWPLLFSLPILFAGISLTPTTPQRVRPHIKTRRALPLGTVLPAALGLLLITSGLLLEEPGKLKTEGRVLIDEGHANWEWADEPMTPETFGTRTTYNYYGLHQLLKQYYDARLNHLPLTDSLLAHCDVLVLKTPTTPYTPDEQEAIKKFTYEGGGLYLISDHTDIFGMSSFLNPLAREFGFEYNFDVVFDLFELKDQSWKARGWRPHPAAQHLESYHYLTGCSIRPLPGSRMVMLGQSAGTDLLSYATSNYFDTHPPQAELRFGSILQLVSTRYGRGRVIGFSDSTTYSNFAMFWPGRLEHLLGIVDWLMRQNSSFPLGLLLSLLGLPLLLLARMRGFRHIHIKPLLLPAIGLAFLLSQHLQARDYPPLEIENPGSSISFDAEHSTVTMPLLDKVDPMDAQNFETFFVWLYRSNRFPIYGTGEPDSRADLHILINPTSMEEKDFANLDTFMENGGNVLLLITPEVDPAPLAPWLKRHGLSISSRSMREVEVMGGGLDFPWLAPQVQLVGGGQAWYTIDEATHAAVRQTVGEGELLLSGLGSSMTNRWLGRYDSVPAGEALEVLKIYYDHLSIEADFPKGTFPASP
jgi:hypothetical protein